MSAYRIFIPDAEPLDNAPMTPTVREIFTVYLAHCQKNNVLNQEALHERTRVLNLFADANVNGCTIGEMTPAECMPFFLTDWIEANPRWKSPSTRKVKANGINAAFNWATNGRRITDNPFRGVNYEDAEPREPLLDCDLTRIMDLANKPFEELLTFLRLTSRRISEICRLEWAHIDWEKASVRVPRHKTRKKTRKDQEYALVPEAVDLLLKIKGRLTGPPVGVVFTNSIGRPWTKGNAGNYMRRLKNKLGMTSKGSLHGIRHQAITEMIRNGASIKAASLQAGHSETRTTERVYCHMANAFDEMREAVKLGLKGLTPKPDVPRETSQEPPSP